MSLANILSPGKGKILLALFFSIAWVTAAFSIESLGLQKAFDRLELQEKALVGAMNILIFLILYYPLSCGIIHICRRAGGMEGSGDHRDQLTAALLILVFNPLFFSLMILGGTKIYTETFSRPCGVEVIGFTENSGAENAGIRVGDVIRSVDGRPVDTAAALQDYLKSKREGDVLTVSTNRGEYKIKTAPGGQKGFPVLGVNVKTAYCAK